MLESLLEHLDNTSPPTGHLNRIVFDVDYGSLLLYDCLAIAVENNNDNVVSILLEFVVRQTLDNDSTQACYTPLHCAAANADIDVIKLLIESGIDVNQANREGETALHFAPNANTAEVLIANGADVNGITRIGTPLYYALARYRFGVIETLLANGAKPNTGSRTLNEACRSDVDSFIARSLLDFHVEDVFIPSGCVWHALSGRVSQIVNGDKWLRELCKSCKSESQPMVAELLARTATVVTLRHFPPLHIAIYELSKANKLTEVEMMNIDALLADSAVVNSVDTSGTTALYIAVERNLIELATILLDFGAAPNLTTSSKFPLIVACRYLSYEFVRLLLNRGADPNVADCQGKSPLGIAVASFDQPLVELLVEHGADVHHRDNRGRTALYSIIDDFQESMYLCPASAAGCIGIVKFLIDNGSEVNETYVSGQTVLLRTIHILFDCYVELGFIRSSVLHRLVDLLLKAGADAKCAMAMWATITGGNFIVTRELLRHGADPNQVLGLHGYEVLRPLSLACRESNLQCARILLAAGANPDLIDWEWCDWGCSLTIKSEIVKLLLNSRMKLIGLWRKSRIPKLTNFFLTICKDASWISMLFKAGSNLWFLENVCKNREKTFTNVCGGPFGGRLCQAIVFAGHKVQQQQLVQRLRESGRCQDQDLASWLEKNSMTPPSLSCLSRTVIRRQLSAASGWQTILPLFDVLPIPKQLQMYLRFEGPLSEVDLNVYHGGNGFDSCCVE